MTPEEKSLLERTYKIAEENNGILRSIQRANRLSLTFRILYWLVIIGFSYGAYYFIQPYLQTMLGLYDQVQGNVNTVQSLTNKFGDLLK